jgi:hypothetical protein
MAAGAALALATLALAAPPGAAVLEQSTRLQRSADRVWPSPSAASDDRGRAYRDGCIASDRATTSPPCVYGHPASATTVVLFGDSHALHFFPAIEPIAVRRGLRLVHLTKKGCPPADVTLPHYAGNPAPYTTCNRWREHALERIAAERPALVIVVGASHYHVVRGGRILGRRASNRRIARGYVRTLERLRQLAARVTVIRDTPFPDTDIPACVEQGMRALRGCAFPRSSAFPRDDAITPALRSLDGIALVDATSRFCPRRLCPAVIGDALVYRNTSHITATYAATLSPWLETRLSVPG